MRLRLKTNLAQFRRSLSDTHKRQVPFAAAVALNEIATAAQTAIVTSMQATFDRPTPYTLRATYVKRARRSDLRAFVGIREFAGKGTPAWKYLGPETKGGPRGQKRFERRLQSIDGGPAFVVPGRGAKLDSYGNLSRGQISKILSAVGAFADTGQNISAASSARRARKGMPIHKASLGGRSNYFIARSKRSGRPIGIYELVGRGHVEPVLLFTDRAPDYSARWPFSEIVLKAIDRTRVGAFERAWAHALATAR